MSRNMSDTKIQKKTSPQENQITEGVIWKQLLLFFFPILFGTFFQQLYNTADAVIVGNFVGKEALASVGGPTAVLINLLVGFFVGLSSGATVIISQHFGAGLSQKVSDSVHTAIALALAGGAVLMVIGIAIAPWALRALNTPAELMGPSVTYMKIYFAGVIPAMLYNIGSGILRAVGDSKKPLYFLITACLLNIVLDLVFVAVLDMGVAGVGIATVIAQTAAAALTVGSLMRTRHSYRLYPKKISFHRHILASILRIGLPAGLQSSMYSISNLLIQSSINGFGTDTVAAWTAYGKLDSIYWMIISAYGVSITTFVGQNFGAGKMDRVKKSVRICTAFAVSTSLLISFIVLRYGTTLLLLFTRDTNVIEICAGMIRNIAPAYVCYVCIEILSGTCRGCGDSVTPTLLTCFGVCILRILWITIMVPLRTEVSTVAFSYPLTWTITSLLFIIYYKKGKWMKRNTLHNAPESK